MGLIRADWGDYVYIAGPVFDTEENLAGVILVGKSAESLIQQIREDTLAQISLYTLDGDLLASTALVEQDIPPVPSETIDEIVELQDQGSITRDLTVASANYSEILGPWELRGGEDLGAMGVALPQNFLVRPSNFTRFQVFFVIAIIFLSVIMIGIILARQVTTPLAILFRHPRKSLVATWKLKYLPSAMTK